MRGKIALCLVAITIAATLLSAPASPQGASAGSAARKNTPGSPGYYLPYSYSQPRTTARTVARCSSLRSYDAATGTYRGRDGLRHRCR